MKRAIKVFCFLVIVFQILCITVHSYRPVVPIRVDSKNVIDDAKYIELLVYMDEKDDAYSECNVQNESQFKFKNKMLEEYNEDGYISFSYHYSQAYTDATLRFNSSGYSVNAYVLKQASTSIYDVDACNVELLEKIIEERREFKLAVLNSNGDIIQVSDSFSLVSRNGILQDYFCYDISNNKLKCYEYPGYIIEKGRDYSIRRNKIPLLILAILLLVIVVLFVIGVLIFKFKISQKEQYKFSKKRIIITLVLHILLGGILFYFYPPWCIIYLFIFLFSLFPFIFRAIGVYSRRTEIVLCGIELLIHVMLVLGLMFHNLISIWFLLTLLYGVLAILLDISRKGKIKLWLVGIEILGILLLRVIFRFLFGIGV